MPAEDTSQAAPPPGLCPPPCLSASVGLGGASLLEQPGRGGGPRSDPAERPESCGATALRGLGGLRAGWGQGCGARAAHSPPLPSLQAELGHPGHWEAEWAVAGRADRMGRGGGRRSEASGTVGRWGVRVVASREEAAFVQKTGKSCLEGPEAREDLGEEGSLGLSQEALWGGRPEPLPTALG